MAFRLGVRLALDWGSVRIGVAACDREGILAYPVTVLANDEKAVEELVRLVAEYEPMEVLLGLPTDLRGEDGPAAQRMREVFATLAEALPVPIRLVDERMSSATAHRQLSEAGRSTKNRKSVIDQAAAVGILENAIRAEKLSGEAA